LAEVRWAQRALDDLREIHGFIARDSPRAAEALVERIFAASEQLAAFPLSGRLVPEFPGSGYRELLVGNYRVQYRVADAAIWIVTVVHGMRLPIGLDEGSE
jgi:toxin ParE1/3/4